MTTYWHNNVTLHPPVGAWMWHLHHEVLCEPLTEPLRNRLDYILAFKPVHEIDIRLGATAPVWVILPSALIKAWVAYDKAWVALIKARVAYDKAWAAIGDEARAAENKAWAVYVKVRAATAPELEALHAIDHPGCPWDGRSIFPEAAS